MDALQIFEYCCHPCLLVKKRKQEAKCEFRNRLRLRLALGVVVCRFVWSIVLPAQFDGRAMQHVPI